MTVQLQVVGNALFQGVITCGSGTYTTCGFARPVISQPLCTAAEHTQPPTPLACCNTSLPPPSLLPVAASLPTPALLPAAEGKLRQAG